MKLFCSCLNFFSNDLALDLGTVSTRIYLRGRGAVLSEPSAAAVSRNGRILAAGQEAVNMTDKIQSGITDIRPLKDGRIADFEIFRALLCHFIRKIRKIRFSRFKKLRLIAAVPSGFTQEEKKAVREAAAQAGASEVCLIKKPLAAAIGAGLLAAEPAAGLILDIGGGTAEAAVISRAGLVCSQSVPAGGLRMDEAIAGHIRKKYRLLISEFTAEAVKQKIGTACPSDQAETLEVRGRDTVTGLLRTVTVDAEEIGCAIAGQADSILSAVLSTIEQIPPELAAPIAARGLVLTGGGALLRCLDSRLREVTRLPVSIAADPLTAAARGCGQALENPAVLRAVSIS
ncbi:MAG: rod shape-determining protein [Deltaproteobacteria bacterium]|jgi:rod shape-determining protein MreB|nr:rod shape-determining protein [Deltaproteobacteria bacterium]